MCPDPNVGGRGGGVTFDYDVASLTGRRRHFLHFIDLEGGVVAEIGRPAY